MLSLLLTLVLLPAVAPGGDVTAILGRHADAVGRSAGDVELVGNLSGNRGAFGSRTLIRLVPFALRREFTLPGKDEPLVFVSDGRRAWHWRRGERGVPLQAAAAIATIEAAFEAALLLDPLRFAEEGWVDAPSVLPAVPGYGAGLGAGRDVLAVNFSTPAGTLWQALFDVESGRLAGLHSPTSPEGHRWVRYGDWRDAGGILLPALRVEGVEGSVTSALHLHELRAGLDHPADLFAGNPQQRPQPGAVVAPLARAASAVPGSSFLILPEVAVNGTGPLAAIVDTGADAVYVRPELAERLKLPLLGRENVTSITGRSEAAVHWVDTLDLGRDGSGPERLLQLAVTAIPLPGFPELPADAAAWILLGGAPLLDAAPVLDLAAGALRLRGEAATPLPGAVTLPLRIERGPRPKLLVDVTVGGRTVTVLLDTSLAPVLRLGRAGMERLGLPTTAEVWLARGALPYPLFGGGDGQREDLLVRLDEVALGPIVYRRPWVLLGELDEAGPTLPHDGLLGFGALVPFAQVGLDVRAGRLELVPGEELRQGGDGMRIEVPAPGEFLGFFLRPPEPGASDEPDNLPYVLDVCRGGPAARADVRAGDRLQSVDGLSTAGRAPAALWPSLWPAPGERRRLTFLRGDATYSVELP